MGFSTTSSVGLMVFHRCSGTIGTVPSTSGPLTKAGALNVKVTWVSSTAVAVPSKPMLLMAALFFNRPKVNATSFAVKGWPSLHVTPSRRVTERTVPSLFQDCCVPSSGTRSDTLALLTKNSVS